MGSLSWITATCLKEKENVKFYCVFLNILQLYLPTVSSHNDDIH